MINALLFSLQPVSWCTGEKRRKSSRQLSLLSLTFVCSVSNLSTKSFYYETAISRQFSRKLFQSLFRPTLPMTRSNAPTKELLTSLSDCRWKVLPHWSARYWILVYVFNLLSLHICQAESFLKRFVCFHPASHFTQPSFLTPPNFSYVTQSFGVFVSFNVTNSSSLLIKQY